MRLTPRGRQFVAQFWEFHRAVEAASHRRFPRSFRMGPGAARDAAPVVTLAAASRGPLAPEATSCPMTGPRGAPYLGRHGRTTIASGDRADTCTMTSRGDAT